MSLLLEYGIKLSIGLAAVWLFYALLLRRLTFYNINRWYLLLYSAAALLIPFVDISPLIESNEWTSNNIIQIVPVIDNALATDNDAIASSRTGKSEIGLSTISAWIFSIGVVVMIIRLIVLYISLLQIRRRSVLLNNNGVKLYQVNKNIIPFSFGNAIFINKDQHGDEELQQIIRHEFIHVTETQYRYPVVRIALHFELVQSVCMAYQKIDQAEP